MATAAQTVTIYNNVLQRDPTQAEIAAFVAGSQTADGEAAQIDLLVNSSEAVEDVYPFVRVYQAIFGRVPDAAGFNFWVDAMRSGLTLQTLITGDEDLGIDGFANSAEFIAEYGADASATDEAFITALYNNLLGRDPDQAGLDFYTGLPEGTPVGDVVAAFTESPEFSGSIDAQIAIFLEKAAIGAQDYVGSVYDIDDDGDVDADDEVEDNPGDTFTLVAGTADDLTGGLGDDTFNAPALALETGDVVEGAGGNDTLEIVAGGYATGAAPTVSNVERINNAEPTAVLDLSNVTGLQQIWSSGATAAYTGAMLGLVFGVQDAAGSTVTVTLDADVDLSGNADSVSLAAEDNTGTAVVTFGAADADIEAVNVAAGTAAGTVDVGNFTAAETVTVTGAGDVTVDVAGLTALTSVDASAATGDVTVAASASVETLTGGAGDDTLSGGAATDLSIDAGAGDDGVTLAGQVDATVDLGAGNDTLTLGGGEAGLSATLGAGGDTVVLTTIANIDDADEADFAADIIVINDFTVGEDVIDIAGVSPTHLATLNDAQQTSIEGAASLFAAVTAAAATGATLPIVFDFGGNAYIYHDAAAGGGFNIGDGLVQLTGVSSADLDASNLI